MKQLIKKYIFILLLFAIITLLSGCITRPIDDLYKVPRVSDEYVQLQGRINEVLQMGAEYAAPIGGSHRQSVQLFDIDYDGVDEAIAFFRMPGDKPLKIYVFRNIDGEYEVATTIEGEGSYIESIQYSDLDGDGKAEIIVGWTMSGDIHMLGVYSLRDYHATALMLTDYYEYLVFDLDGDERYDMTVVRHDRSEKYGSAETYFFRSDGEIESSTARLSAGLETVERVRTGVLSDGVPAIYVEGAYEGGNVITDIIAWRDEMITNVTMDSATGVSNGTIRNYTVYASDINGDGCIDIPMPQILPAQNEETVYRIINWYNYSLRGTATKTLSTYHNYSDGWYLTLPTAWTDVLTIRREDTVSGERAVVFSVWNGEGETVTDFLVLYTLTGDNRADKATADGRIVLRTGGETIYAAKILLDSSGWKYAISKTELTSRFNIIYSEWITGII